MIKRIGAFILDLLLHSGIILPFFNQFYSMLYELELLSGERNKVVELIVSLSIVFLWTIFSLVLWNVKKKTKLGKWYITNYSKFAFLYMFLYLLFLSVRKDAVWDYEQMKDIVNIQWTIFGLSITVFLVWHVLIFSYFKKVKPQKPIDNDDKILQIQNINIRMQYQRRVDLAYSAVTYVMVNFIALFFITLIVYTVNIVEKSAIIDNCLRFSLLITLHTLFKLLMEMLKPLKEEKKEILDNITVSNQEIEEHNNAFKQIDDALSMIDIIDKIDVLTEQEKLRVKVDLIRKIKGADYNPDTISCEENVDV